MDSDCTAQVVAQRYSSILTVRTEKADMKYNIFAY